MTSGILSWAYRWQSWRNEHVVIISIVQFFHILDGDENDKRNWDVFVVMPNWVTACGSMKKKKEKLTIFIFAECSKLQ